MTGWLKWLGGDDVTSTDAHSPQTSPGSESVALATSNLPNLHRLIGLFMGLGLLARIIRYYLCFPLWDDESFLCVNFISRSYRQLLQPLDFHQVAPILFLWIERASVQIFGYSEYSLRLFPFLCAIISVFLFRRVARQLLTGLELLFAVAVFAVSYPEIRYAAEAKPYCTDMFMSLVMLSLILTWQRRRDVRLLGLLAVLMPFILGLSYPAVFAAGGMSLVVGGVLWWQHGKQPEWIAWLLWNLSLVASFGFWFRAVAQVQSGAESEFMGEYWKQNFPPVSQPWNVPYWVLKTHASDFLAYPLGGPNWASVATLLVCLAGLWRLIAERKWLILGLLIGPASLHLFAAALQRYPYGGHVKFSQYLAPMICCLIGAGMTQLVEWSSRLRLPTSQGLAVGCAGLFLIGVGAIGRDLANPYKTRSDFRARAFAQSFWVGAHSAEEVACMKTDLGLDFVPDQFRELSWSAHYLCNHAIEVSRSNLPRANLDKVSATRPLRCVLYHDARYQLAQPRLNHWLAEMQRNYELVAHESLPFPRMAKDDHRLVTMEYVDSYKFVPRDDSKKELPPLADGHQPAAR